MRATRAVAGLQRVDACTSRTRGPDCAAMLFAWLSVTVAFLIASKLISGVRLRGGLFAGLVVAALFAGLNFFLGWVLFTLLGLVTFGLGFLLAFVTRFIVTAWMIQLTARVSSKLEVESFGAAAKTALVVALTSAAFEVVGAAF